MLIEQIQKVVGIFGKAGPLRLVRREELNGLVDLACDQVMLDQNQGRVSEVHVGEIMFMREHPTIPPNIAVRVEQIVDPDTALINAGPNYRFDFVKIKDMGSLDAVTRNLSNLLDQDSI